MLLKADINQDGGGYLDRAIADALDLSVSTIERVRQGFVERGLEYALNRQVQTRHKPRRLAGQIS